MKFNLNKKQTLTIVAVLAVGVLLAVLILGTAKPTMEGGEHAREGADAPVDENAQAAAPKKGPHGGKLFTQDGYGIEVTIFETNVEPEFRVYAYLNNKPLDPKASQVAITLGRLGRAPQVFRFAPEADYLKGDAIVVEPHSFEVGIDAQHAGKTYRFGYAQEEARVRMTEPQRQQSGVEVLTAGPARIQSVLDLIGEIRFNEDRQVRIVPRLTGVVESVAANAGDTVKKGQVLAVIFSAALADQRSELLAAQKRLTLAHSTYAREKKLWEDRISAEQDYLQAQAALAEAEIAAQNARQKLASIGGEVRGGSLTRYEIRAPMSGVVVAKNISLGETVKEDATIFTVADLSTVWADMTIYAKDLNTVKVGQKATVKASAFESESSGVISYVSALVGEQTRTATARVVLPNPKGVWRPGLPVNIKVVSGEVEVPVAVSAEAIQTVRDWTVVFGRYGDAFEARPVELGRSDGKLTEVVSGLNAGETYAAKNSFLIKADIGKSGASHDH